MSSSVSEPVDAALLKTWIAENGGAFHPHARFVEGPAGLSVIADTELVSNTKIVTCPFALAITESLAQQALLNFLDSDDLMATKGWTERQWIASYLCFHWINGDSSHLAHRTYLKTLPPPHALRTPLHFTPLELEMFKGTNLYGAALDREREWQTEWRHCHGVITGANSEWGHKFSWELYLTAATYISSRAFPSTILSRTPSLQSSPSTKPILLPGIDSLNHGRGQPVSWVVSYPDINETETALKTPNISLVLHTPTERGQELLNNYGAKPNSELILGYGFSLPQNPDDTIVLKIGGIDGKKWEVGRSAKGVEGIWNEIVRSIQEHPDSPPNYEDNLNAAGALMEMVEALLDRLSSNTNKPQCVDIRPEVSLMFHDYVEGQRDILGSLIGFAREQELLAIEAALAEGVKIVLED